MSRSLAGITAGEAWRFPGRIQPEDSHVDLQLTAEDFPPGGMDKHLAVFARVGTGGDSRAEPADPGACPGLKSKGRSKPGRRRVTGAGNRMAP